MAVGDIINSVAGLAATSLVFQPAAGVEVMITGMFGSGFLYYGLQSVAIPATGQVLIIRDTVFSNSYNIKIGVTNTVFWKQNATVAQHGFSGIQIK